MRKIQNFSASRTVVVDPYEVFTFPTPLGRKEKNPRKKRETFGPGTRSISIPAFEINDTDAPEGGIFRTFSDGMEGICGNIGLFFVPPQAAYATQVK